MIFFDPLNIDTNKLLIIIDKQINLQNLKLKNLLQCLKTLNEAIQNSDNIDNPNKITKLLKELKSNLDDLRTNIADLNYLKKLCENNEIEELCSKADVIYKKIYDIYINTENFFIHYSKDLKYQVKETKEITSSKEVVTDNICKNQEKTCITEVIDSKVLFISEKENKVVLPYTVSELEKILKTNSKYNTLQEIIENEYTFTLDRFKNASISRFKEGYNLMRKKEKASIVDSLNLALELSFNNLLNPAVIVACKNLDELDIYLDCLDSKELENFKFFEVKYEISPKLKNL